MADDELHQSIRERLATGRLFCAYGAGRPCNVCGKAIAKEGIEA